MLNILVEAVAKLVVEESAEVALDFIEKNTPQSAAADHAKGLDHVTNDCSAS